MGKIVVTEFVSLDGVLHRFRPFNRGIPWFSAAAVAIGLSWVYTNAPRPSSSRKE